jgi:hypothetical protein
MGIIGKRLVSDFSFEVSMYFSDEGAGIQESELSGPEGRLPGWI